MKKNTFSILCLEGAILSFNVAAAAALVPSIARSFSVSAFSAGMLIWMYMLPYGVAALIYGPLIRVFDAKKVELVCMFAFSLANVLAGLSNNIAVLFTARFFMGLFGASVIPLALILIAREVQIKDRGMFVGIFFSMTFISSLLGLFLSGFLSWRMIFFIPALAGFFLCILIYFYLPNFAPITDKFKINYSSALKEKKILSLFTYIFLISFLYHGVQQWLAVYFSVRYSLSQFLISMLITVTSLSGIFGEVSGGFFSDIIGRRRTVNLGIALMVVSVFALLVHFPLATLFLLMIIWGLGWTINHAGVSTLLTDLPTEFINEAASLNSSVRFLSGGIGVALGGLIMRWNFTLGLMIFGGCLSALLFFNKRYIMEEGR